MKKVNAMVFTLLILTVPFAGCTGDGHAEVLGCNNTQANNYNENATKDDGSCDFDLDDDGVKDIFEVDGCTDNTANNYMNSATDDDDSCDYDLDDDGVLDADEIKGCMDSNANNYDSEATDEDGLCDYDLDDDGVLDVAEVLGCMDSTADNYDPEATDDDGLCDYAPVECYTNTERGIVLSFDDRKNIESWDNSRELLNSRGVKATFFVDNWATINDWELEILNNLSLDGHEIGYHSTSHGDYYDFLEQNLTAENYFQTEIIEGLELMESYGYFPTSFAYPRGHRNNDIDELALTEFSVLRGTRTNVNGSESWMAECKDLSVYRSFSLTSNETHWIPYAFNKSQESAMSILLNGHAIGEGGYAISMDAMENLITEIEKFELPYLLMSDLAK